jgi:hypothetical protein
MKNPNKNLHLTTIATVVLCISRSSILHKNALRNIYR